MVGNGYSYKAHFSKPLLKFKYERFCFIYSEIALKEEQSGTSDATIAAAVVAVILSFVIILMIFILILIPFCKYYCLVFSVYFYFYFEHVIVFDNV